MCLLLSYTLNIELAFFHIINCFFHSSFVLISRQRLSLSISFLFKNLNPSHFTLLVETDQVVSSKYIKHKFVVVLEAKAVMKRMNYDFYINFYFQDFSSLIFPVWILYSLCFFCCYWHYKDVYILAAEKNSLERVFS